MAFFDKLGDIAKSIGDITNDAVETTKLNSKINSERVCISELMIEIGEFYYNKHILGEELATEIVEICNKINEHNKNIAEAHEEINRIKTEKEVEKPSTPVTSNTAELACSNCGIINSEGTKFCRECGNKLENKKCPSCGASIKEGVKFCMECGAKLI